MAGKNYGGNPLLTDLTHLQEYNNVTGQGALTKITTLMGRVSYQILGLNAFAEVEGRIRKENAFTSISVLGSLRMNIAYKPVKI